MPVPGTMRAWLARGAMTCTAATSIGCSCASATSPDAGAVDASRCTPDVIADAGPAFHPACQPSATCDPPTGMTALGDRCGAFPLPAAYYAASDPGGCNVLVARMVDGGVRIETSSFGSNWSLSSIDGSVCDPGTGICAADGVPSGTYVFGESSCSLRGCLGYGSFRITVDADAGLIERFETLGGQSVCPTTCALCN